MGINKIVTIKRVSNGSFLFYVYNHRGNLKNWLSITKFTEMGWNDGVFEGTEEQLDGLVSALVFIYYCEFWFFLHAKIYYILYIFKEAKLAKFIRYEVGWKMMRDDVIMWWCGDVIMWWWDGGHGLKIWGIGFYAKLQLQKTIPLWQTQFSFPRP